MTLKILALNPPFLPRYSRQSRSPCVAKGGTFYYPYYLAYAAGSLEKAGFSVKLVDSVANEWGRERTFDFIRSYKPDFIVIDTSTPSISNDIEVAEGIKKMLPDSHVNLVGTHPTNLPKQTLSSKGIDSVCIGEFDYTVVDLARCLESGKDIKTVKGLAYRKGKRIFRNAGRGYINNLDELPFVSEVYKRHLNIKKYFYASLRHPQVTILTARGCPYNCSFCNIPFKASYRRRSTENVLNEMEYIENEIPYVKEIMIEDDTFPVDRKRTIEMCKGKIERGIKIRWSCNARVNTDYGTLREMKRAGCRLMCVGFESPKKKMLDAVSKKTNADVQMKFMEDTRKLGLLVNGCFILGLPGDTRETIRETIEFAKRLNPDTAQFYPLMVYPGTSAYGWAKKNGYLKTEDYSRWLTEKGSHKTNVKIGDIDPDDLMRYCDEARKEYYLRRKYLFYKIKQTIVKPSELKRTLKSFKTFYKYL